MSKVKFFTNGPKRKVTWGKLGEELLGGLAKEMISFPTACAREAYRASGMPIADCHRTFRGDGKTIVLIEKK